MARDMGADRDSLVSQALFMFARLNGYLSPAAPGASIRSNPPPVARDCPRAPIEPSGSRQGGDLDAVRRTHPPPKLSEPPASEPPRREVADRVLETAAELERLMKDKPQFEAGALDAPAAGPELFLVGESGALDKVAKERFVIGRGKHCDLVINSGKVSREHAAILREGSDHFIEDLGSSNGTWFDKQRIHRRKIENGDEYFICNEKVKCVIR